MIERQFNIEPKIQQIDQPIDRILLINPNHPDFPYDSTRYPLGIFSLASNLHVKFPKKHIAVLDLQAVGNTTKFADIIREFNPQLLGFTAMTPYVKEAARLSIEASTFNPGVISVVGGVHTTTSPEETIGWGTFDAAIRGYGEEALTNLIDALDQKGNLRDCAGLIFNSEKDGLIKTKVADLRALDDYPFASLALELSLGNPNYGVSIMQSTAKKSGSIMTARGCPFTCKFCINSMYTPDTPKGWQRVKERSPQQVVDELEYLYKEKGVTFFYFLDETINLRPDRIVAIAEEIKKRNLKISWVAIGRTDYKESERSGLREMYQRMKEAGCMEISLGVESGDPAVRRAMHKGSNIDEVIATIQLLNELDISTKVLLMVGCPEERYPESTNLTIDLLRRAKPRKIRISTALPLPGTAWANDPRIRLLPGVGYSDLFIYPPLPGLSPYEVDKLRDLTYTHLMSPSQIKLARAKLIEVHKAYGGV